jgi:hypothetical protein
MQLCGQVANIPACSSEHNFVAAYKISR